MLNIPNYQIGTQIYESANSLVYRGIRKKDNQSVILKVLKEDYPTPAELTRYRQEYEITHDLDLAGVVKAYSIEKYQNTLVIILEDFGGESLKQLMRKNPLTVKEFLPLAIQIAESLGNIHAANIIHKDINPANVVWNQKTNQLKIIDFGIASRLPRENPTLKNPEQLEGTLAYISPEQTGRMNRSLDYRTDLYSLGVTFYELLTGLLPFESDSAMELVHSHIAKMSVPVVEINPNIPPIISDIVMKLMAKNVEDRYQSAFGVKFDLEKVFKAYSDQNDVDDSKKISPYPPLQKWGVPPFDKGGLGGILDFELAQNDFSGRLQIPQKLYGREHEINTLLQSFERVSSGKTEMMLVAGYSGVGKTALVHEVHKPMTEKHGYFATGKFDQFQKNIPYSAITQAFNEFCRYLLMESTETLANWQNKILDAMGNNGQIIIDVIPDLELVIGKQPKVAEVGTQETQNRFQMFFLNFIKTICDKSHPFVLFIDDLQWADSASLTLLKTILLDDTVQNLLIIGAYRDNEVDATHPLMMTVEELQKANTSLNTIKLDNLQTRDVNQLLQESLHCETGQIQSLSDLIYQKTQGNAFFTRQFLNTLYKKQLLHFDFNQRQWIWNVEQITAQNITDNVVELMANKIEPLSTQTVIVLQLAACIGNQFDLSLLAIIYQHNPSETLTVLWEAIQEGLIQPLNDNYKHLESGEKVTFKFLHDRIQQAAYSRIDYADKQKTHLKIGRLLLANTSHSERKEHLFDIVNQLNIGRTLISEDNDILKLAQINLEAAQKAKESIAYFPAFQYVTTGIELLPENSWKNHYALTFALYREYYECAYLTANFAQAEQLVEILLANAQSKLDKAAIYNLCIVQYTMAGKYPEAIQKGYEALQTFGIELPKNDFKTAMNQKLQEVKALIADREAQDFLNSPMMTDQEQQVILEIFVHFVTPAYFNQPDLALFLMIKMAMIPMNYGISEQAPLAYSQYCTVLMNVLNDYKTGYDFGQLSIQLSDKLNIVNQKARMYFAFGNIINHWCNPMRSNLTFLKKSYQYSIESGDLQYAGFSLGSILYTLTSQGETLAQILIEAKKGINFSRRTKNVFNTDICIVYQQFILNLQGKTRNQTSFNDEAFDEQQFLENAKDHPLIRCLFYIYKAQAHYLHGHYQIALNSIKEAKQVVNYLISLLPIVECYFYDSLILTALYSTANKQQQSEYWAQLEINQKKMKIWADSCPENFLNRYLLVEAEIARLVGDNSKTIDLYDKAIESAEQNAFVQNKALANELVAHFWLAKAKEKIAKVYLQEAHYGYQQWGAFAKVNDLEEQYPQWLIPKIDEASSTLGSFNSTATILASTQTRASTSQWLDLDSVMKAAQILSGEIVLSRLLSKMMHIVIENAGAERGFLILPQDDKWVIEAEGAIDKDEITVLHSLPIENYLPDAIISYVARTQENVVLTDARQEGLYTENPYIKTHQTQSVLCFPIVYQLKLRAILYFENNLSTGAFTSQRLNVLQMLSSQIAISLENAQYATQLEDKVKRRTVQLATANEEITALNEMLKEENLRMGAELDVAKQLQQMVLPKEEELSQIKELDIAGFMEPADEVGGDYYDVLVENGHLKIGIGDVTGHGLESGVLMLMVQTTVQALLLAGVDNPEQFLNVVNRTIYKNVQRVGTDKNLTLSLLDYQQGQLQLTGQHEDVLVVRQNGEVERIDTIDLGFSIGLKADIASLVEHKELSLQPGDGIVLYTDGITEAQNPEEEQYGVDRLCEVVSQNWHLEAKEIQQAVIEDVRQFISEQKVFDDITLLVLKQK